MEELDNIIEKMMNEKFDEIIDKITSEDFKICCKCKNGVKSIQIKGNEMATIIGLISLEKVILSKTNFDKEQYEFLRKHIGYEIIK